MDSECNTCSDGKYQPPKMWKDLTADEKIERMRQEIKQLQHQLGNNGSRISNMEDDFKNHDHLNGKVVNEVRRNSGLFGAVGKSLCNPEAEAKGECYF